MKQLFVFGFLFCFSVCFAQDQRLFDNDWYLHKLTLDGEDFVPPSNDEIPFIRLNIFSDYFETGVCVGMNGGGITISNTEIVVSHFAWLTGPPCVLEENNIYESLYFYAYFESQLPDRIFSYEIIEDSDQLFMVWTNLNGDKAFYGNQMLTSPTFDAAEFIVSPNPVKNKIYLSGAETGELNIHIFNIEGQLLSEIKLFSENPIDVSNLSNGIYIIRIQDKTGNSAVRKFIKN